MTLITRVIGVLSLLDFISRLALWLSNWRRSRVKQLDYVMFTLPQQIPAVPEPRSWIQRRLMGDSPLSLLELDHAFKRIAADPRPKGVILHLRGFKMGMADIQTLRDSILRLRESGKRVICYASNYDTVSYYVASAADEILMQPGGNVMTIGLRREMLFLRDGLDAIGVQIDAVAISPYKGAADTMTRTEPSEEGRAQMDWLLDSSYEMIVGGIAACRKLPDEKVAEMIDTAPHIDSSSMENGYVDGLVNEEGLATYLEVEEVSPWKEADSIILEKPDGKSEKYVTVLHLSGMIVDGKSEKPPVNPPVPIPFVGGERMGDMTVVEQVRNIAKDEHTAAVVVYVDSQGGSASASEAMTSALEELAKEHPIVVYMGNVAASGGYYISTPAQWIVAQPGTITGSIGVVTAKAVNNEMMRKLRFNPVEFVRGDNADIFASGTPFSDGQRGQIRDTIVNMYQQFIGRVSQSRNMTTDDVDEIGGGRVWTGAQAYQNGLVDQLGGLQEAIEKARELAELPANTPFAIYGDRPDAIPDLLGRQLNPAAWFGFVKGNLDSITSGKAQFLMPIEWQD